MCDRFRESNFKFSLFPILRATLYSWFGVILLSERIKCFRSLMVSRDCRRAPRTSLKFRNFIDMRSSLYRSHPFKLWKRPIMVS